MDVELVEQLDANPLSPARRIFALQQMLTVLSESPSNGLHRRIERLIQLDGDNLRRSTLLRGCEQRPQEVIEQTCRPAMQRRDRAHRDFVHLIIHINRSQPSSLRKQLLKPVRRQLDRILDLGADPGQPAAASRFERPLT